jgi:hypothetical protein
MLEHDQNIHATRAQDGTLVVAPGGQEALGGEYHANNRPQSLGVFDRPATSLLLTMSRSSSLPPAPSASALLGGLKNLYSLTLGTTSVKDRTREEYEICASVLVSAHVSR